MATITNASDSVTYVWRCESCNLTVATPRVLGLNAQTEAWFIKHPLCRNLSAFKKLVKSNG